MVYRLRYDLAYSGPRGFATFKQECLLLSISSSSRMQFTMVAFRIAVALSLLCTQV